MKVIITGAGGFLGQRVALFLLSKTSPLKVDELVLVDLQKPNLPKEVTSDHRIKCQAVDIASEDAPKKLIEEGRTPDVIFHLAAIVSGHAEADFELGLNVNFFATLRLLNAIRNTKPSIRLVFTSTMAVFGGELPAEVDEFTRATPQNSYGTAKAMSELLINDYSRRDWVDGVFVRLPTVTVRAGTANQAVTSYVSGIIREPLNGMEALCPVDPELESWITSPATVVDNIVHAGVMKTETLGSWKGVNLPGLTINANQMLEALRNVAGEEITKLVRFKEDEKLSKMLRTFPGKMDNTRALKLGFKVDKSFEDIIRAYIRDDLKRL